MPCSAMTRTPHDQFAKQYLSGLLEKLGSVEVSREVSAEVRQVDLYFRPDATPQRPRDALGLLGQLLTHTCLLEPFRNAVTLQEVRTCLSKLFDIQADLLRDSKRNNTRLHERNLPQLWILTPTASRRVLNALSAQESQSLGTGLYELAPFLHTGFIVIHHLPVTPETLWLRLLGRKSVQAQAIDELLNLPRSNPWQRDALEQIGNLQITLQTRQNLNREEQELFMNLSPAYLRWREETLSEGRAEGRVEGRAEGRVEGRAEGRVEGRAEGRAEGQETERHQEVEELLTAKFGELDAELRSLIEILLPMPRLDRAQLILQLSRDELMAHCRQDP